MLLQNSELSHRHNGIWLVILSAGYSHRMGTQKLLLPIGNETLIRHVIKKVLNTAVEGIVVVTNSDFPDVKKEISDLPVVILENDQSYVGMSSSLKLGIRFLTHQTANAVIILLGDQPGISPVLINTLCQRFTEEHQSIIQAKYNGIPSHPILFSKYFFRDLMQISGDQGARQLLKNKENEIAWEIVRRSVPKDIDTPEDFHAYRELQEKEKIINEKKVISDEYTGNYDKNKEGHY